MSAAGNSVAVQPKRVIGRPFKPGQSGNPGGLSRAEQLYRDQVRAALQKQETPERVCKLAAAMWKDGTSHGKTAPAAAKVYAELIGLKGILGDSLDEKVSAQVEAKLLEMLAEAEAERARAGAIDVEPVTP